MKLFKKVFMIIALVFVAFLVVGCNDNNSNKDNEQEQTNKEYTISWVVDDETVKTTQVKEGEMPDFGGTPTKEISKGYEYTFSKWDPELVAAVADATYTAVFDKTAKRLPSSVSFDAAKFPYDGTEHSLEITGLPEGATVVYENNGRTEPGSQKVKAIVTYYGADYDYSANLIVEKVASQLTIDTVQLVESGENLTYELNNDEQVLSYNCIYQPGKYTVEVYAVESTHYSESAHYEVKVTVTDKAPLGIEFHSCTTILEGESVELLANNIPEGYTATYENNVATSIGKKYVTCHVFDADNNEVATLKAIWTVDYPKNEEFNTFLDEFLVSYLYDDFSTWNAFFRHPEKLGFNREDFGDAEWYTYEPNTEEDRTEALAEIAEIKAEFEAFKDQKLSLAQLVSYDFVAEILAELDEDWAGDLNSGLENIIYVDSYGGYVGNLNTTVENYVFNGEQEIKDVISYIKSASTAFPSYVTWAQDKITAGYALSNYTIDEMIKFIDEILKDKENYYLVSFLENKINGLDFLDDTQKADYVSQLDAAFTNDYFPALVTLKEGLEPCKGHVIKQEDEGYWAKYENGDELYLNKLRSNIGNPDLTIDEYLFYVDKYLKSNSDRINEIIKEYRAMNSKNQSKFISFIEGTTPFVDISDPDEMVTYLKHFALFLVPEFENDVKVNVKYMDRIQGEQTTTQAYYYSSALDELTEESITLNPVLIGKDLNECLSTMAHEGYPGHLYAHVFAKNSEYHYLDVIMDSTGFAEGWAKYVEYQLKQYILGHNDVSQSDRKIMELAMEYLTCNSYAGYLIYCKVDEMAHYEHKSLEEISKYVVDMGYSSDAGLDIYRTVIENPVVYNSYGFGQIYMVDCHNTCKTKLGNLYNEIDFNRVLLEDGQFNLWTINDIMEEYVAENLFLYGNN